MQLFTLYSYIMDGFAYAGEALIGKHIGAQNYPAYTCTRKHLFVWGGIMALLFTIAYATGGNTFLALLTDETEVIEASENYLGWALVIPIAGMAAFIWDGIYIGATASKPIRNTMILAAAGFFLSYFIGLGVLKLIRPEEDGTSSVLAVHILLAAYFVHLAIRTVYLSLRYRKHILTVPFKSQTTAI